jgi:imidazolonepropionase-like amidohydrolase
VRDSAAVTLLAGGTVFPAPYEKPLQNGAVLIEGSTIIAVGRRNAVQIPAGARTIDCSGRSIVSGFWNCHVHFFERKWARAETIAAQELSEQLTEFTRHGFATLYDLSSMWSNTRELRERINSGEVRGPRILSTGEGLIPSGSLPPPAVVTALGLFETPMPEVANVDEALAAVERLLNDRVDGIKLFASSQSGQLLPADIVAAVAERAHAAQRPVFVHPNTAADVRLAAECGVDVIAHTTPRDRWDEALVAEMRTRDVALTPTLQLWDHVLRHDRISARESAVESATDQLRMWAASGGAVLFGTDAGAVDANPAREYALMERAGMDFDSLLDALTTTPARRFAVAERLGRVAEGYTADLVVLGGDPSRDLHALTEVEMVVRAGVTMYSAQDYGLNAKRFARRVERI